jgi:hypothetical protein
MSFTAARTECDRERWRSGLSLYVARTPDGDHRVVTFEQFTFDLPEGSTIVYMPGE